MINHIIQKLKDQSLSIIYYSLGLFIYAWMMVGMFPSVQQANIEGYIDQFPEEMMKFFSGGIGLNMSTIEGFLSIEYLSLFFVLIITFYVAASAGSSIAGAIEKKTMDFQLSQPISRTQLLLSEIYVGLFYTFLIVAINVFFIWILCRLYNTTIGSEGLIKFTFIGTLFMWSIYGIAILLSSFLKAKMRVVSFTLTIVLMFYIFTSLTAIIDKLKDYNKYSLFYFYDPQNLLNDGALNWHHIGIMLSILILGILSSILIFNKRDI